MNMMSLLIASLVGGIASTVLSSVPILNLVNCLLCAGFWLGPLLAVWLYRRMTGSLTIGQALAVGTLAGLWAGIFGFTLSLMGLAGAQALAQSYAQYLPADSGFETALKTTSSVLINLIGVCVNILFGAIAGLVGWLIFKIKSA